MKLKKIISVLAAISMVSSLGFTAVNAANADNPIIHVDSAKFTATETKNYKAVDGYTTYIISYSVEGLDKMAENTAAGITVNYLVDDLSKVDAKSFKKSVANPPTKADLNGIFSNLETLQNIGSNSTDSSANFTVTNADGMYAIFDYESAGADTEKTKAFMQSLVYVKDGEAVTFTYRTSKDAGGNDTTKIAMHDGSAYTTAINFKVNGEATNTLTLGEVAKTKYTVTFMNGEETVQSGEVEEGAVITAPTDPVKAGYTFDGWYDGETKFVAGTTASKNVTYTAKFTKIPDPEQTITVGTPFKGTENKGYVWRVTVKNFKNAGLSYKFTDEDTSEVREDDFNLGSLELSNFVFDVIMNTERANVKLEVN